MYLKSLFSHGRGMRKHTRTKRIGVRKENRMSRLNVLDLSRYMVNEELRLENQNIKNCRISEIKNKVLTIYRCRFNNVEFENSFHEVYASFKECEFEECVFRDTFQGRIWS